MDNDKIQEKSKAVGEIAGAIGICLYKTGKSFFSGVKKQIDEANLKEYEDYKEIKENLKDLNK